MKRKRQRSVTPISLAESKRQSSAEELGKSYHLPYEMIFKILCYLPVESLLRFKNMCRLWHHMIQDPIFIYEHMKRQASHTITYNIYHFNPDATELWIILCLLHGLQLEMCNSTGKYRIKNPSTKEVLALPPTDNNFVLIMTMCYMPSSHQYKVVYLYLDELTNERLGCQVLTIGTDSSWRSIYIPEISYNPEFDKLKDYVFIDGVYYMTKSSAVGDSKLICLEMEKERVVEVSIPLHVFLDRDSTIYPLCWNRTTLSYASIVKQSLHVWILEDYRKMTWSKNKMDLPLNFLRDFPELDDDIYIRAVSDDILLFIIKGEHAIFYSIESESVKYKTSAPPGKKLFFAHNRSTLVSLSGMQPEVD